LNTTLCLPFRVAGCTVAMLLLLRRNSPVSCSMAIVSCAAVAVRDLTVTGLSTAGLLKASFFPIQSSGGWYQVGTAAVERVRKLHPGDRLVVLEGWCSLVPTDCFFTCYNFCVRYSSNEIEACRNEPQANCAIPKGLSRRQN